jgi:2-polyprenyl-3-methyl-5-hydroxy-6-metoxy-1,4-benzoquinol methylase
MEHQIDLIRQKIEILSPIHGKKLKKHQESFDDQYYELAGVFFEKYVNILQQQNKTLDYSIECYLQMLADVSIESIEFAYSGKYTSSTFEEVNERVYANPAIMDYYMHGLILSQFLWRQHYQMFRFFIDSLPAYLFTTKVYLEIGAGHGLYLSKAVEILDQKTSFSVVDISSTSIEFSRRLANDDRIVFNLKDIFEFTAEEKFEFITLGEVLEHVEDPLKLLNKINSLLSDDGVVFITTPTNAPAIDHIYLFNNVDEIRELIKLSGFQIESERSFSSDDVSPEKAAKYKVAILYGAFLKKIKETT